MEGNEKECKHEWQCYGVPIIKTVSYTPLPPVTMQFYIFKNKVKHFRTCKLCGKVELIGETEE
jgi:hypothetical protein